MVLPERTEPAPARIVRRHSPRPGRYPDYRACLRWEFGFSCAFCLLHESDLVDWGAEGTGLMSIEHHVPQSVQPEISGDYSNCFYACRFCNQARGSAPVAHGSGTLLDPCSTPWADRFVRTSDRLSVRSDDDRDAARTHAVYDLDDLRKRRLRTAREHGIEEARRAESEIPIRIERLVLLATQQVDRQDRRELLELVRRLRGLLMDAQKQLLLFSSVPADAPSSCRCNGPGDRSLPRFLAEQCWAPGA
jgi:hypothetical protein